MSGHDAGDRGTRLEPLAAEQVGNDRAGGADGLVEKQDRLGGVEGTEAMVVDDFGDGDFVGAGHGLGQLVVVDQHEPGLDRFENIGLGQNTDQRALVGGNEDGVVGDGEAFADIGDAFVGVDSDERAVDDAFDAGGGADDPGGGGGVVGTDDDRDAVGAGESDGFLVGIEIAGDDEGADAQLDGAELDVAPVADDDNRLAGGDLLALGNAPESGDVHRAEADVEVLDVFLVYEMQGAALEGAGDVGERRVDLAHRAGLVDAGDEDAAQLGHRNGADGFAAGVRGGQEADGVPVDEFEGFGAGGGFGHGDDRLGHQVAHAGRDVGQVVRQRLLEALENGVDAGVGVAAAGGDEAFFAARFFEGGIGDRGAYGVGVRVFVANDVGRDDGRVRGRGGGRRHGKERDADDGPERLEGKAVKKTARSASDRAAKFPGDSGAIRVRAGREYRRPSRPYRRHRRAGEYRRRGR